MRTKILCGLLVIVCLNLTAQSTKLKKAFNGKNLKGWVVPENNDSWTVSNGILNAKSNSEKKGSILWTEKEFENFVVELDFLFGEGKIDSGVFLRAEEQQIQIGESGSLKRDMTASPYIVGKGYPVEASGVKELLKLKGWNTMKIKSDGAIYTVWLNGVEVMTYESESAIPKGPVGLQLHSNRDMDISFKNIKIGKLK